MVKRDQYLALFLLAAAVACPPLPSPALQLQREAHRFKVQVEDVLEFRALSPAERDQAAACLAAVRKTDAAAYAGYPNASDDAKRDAQTMRIVCKGAASWGHPLPDGGAGPPPRPDAGPPTPVDGGHHVG